ncbi:MAG: hypothetical protein R3F49_00110 [Planctomycetota bacterium]
MLRIALTLVAGIGSTAALVHTGALPCPCALTARWLGVSDASCAVAPAASEAAAAAAAASALVGEYLEARDCTVFGGACHVNSEVESQGRAALIAWRLDSGDKVVAALDSEANLSRAGARRAVLFIDGATEREAALLAASAGLEVRATHLVPVTWQREGDAFHVAVEDVLELSGRALADRSCCTMPHAVWYAPLAARAGASVLSPIVGVPDRCRFAGSDGLASWTYEGANTAFVGRFSAPAIAL